MQRQQKVWQGGSTPASLLIIQGHPLSLHSLILSLLLPPQAPPVSSGAIIGIEAQKVLPGFLSEAGLYAAAEHALFEGLPAYHLACSR